jgi:hypothetical protein
MKNEAKLDVCPVEFAKSFTIDCFSNFLGISLADGAGNSQRASDNRVRLFVRHACHDYSEEHPGYTRTIFTLPRELKDRWRAIARYAKAERNRVRAEEALNEANAEDGELTMAESEAQTENFFSDKEQMLIKSLRKTFAAANRGAQVRYGMAEAVANPLRISENIEKLRKECGWSVNKLATTVAGNRPQRRPFFSSRTPPCFSRYR